MHSLEKKKRRFIGSENIVCLSVGSPVSLFLFLLLSVGCCLWLVVCTLMYNIWILKMCVFFFWIRFGISQFRARYSKVIRVIWVDWYLILLDMNYFKTHKNSVLLFSCSIATKHTYILLGLHQHNDKCMDFARRTKKNNVTLHNRFHRSGEKYVEKNKFSVLHYCKRETEGWTYQE